jgi:hypothetical protein
VAKLPTATITNILKLQHRLIDSLDSVTETEFKLFAKYGETAETLPELNELQNTKENLVSFYARLNTLLLKIAGSQPLAANDMLDLLYRSIEVTENGLAAGVANLNEIKRNWSDL